MPPKSIKIQTENEENLNSTFTKPIDEHTDLVLRCVVSGASPSAKLTWLYDSMDPIEENEYLLTAKAIQAYRDVVNNKTKSRIGPHQTRWSIEKYSITNLPAPIVNSSNSNSDNHLRSISILHVRNLTREDADRKLICQAKNSNLTSPLIKQAVINMNCKYIKIINDNLKFLKC